MIGILCTIVCKALFLYPPSDLGVSFDANEMTVNAIMAAVDSYTDMLKGSVLEKKLHDLASYSSIWEGEETEEDEKSDDSFQSKNSPITALKVKDCDALNSLLCSTTIPLFILFHSWKSFLF